LEVLLVAEKNRKIRIKGKIMNEKSKMVAEKNRKIRIKGKIMNEKIKW